MIYQIYVTLSLPTVVLISAKIKTETTWFAGEKQVGFLVGVKYHTVVHGLAMLHVI